MQLSLLILLFYFACIGTSSKSKKDIIKNDLNSFRSSNEKQFYTEGCQKNGSLRWNDDILGSDYTYLVMDKARQVVITV